jgi:hypothetical protein
LTLHRPGSDFPITFLRTIFSRQLFKQGLELELRCLHANKPVVRRFYKSLSEFAGDWISVMKLNAEGYNIHFGVLLRHGTKLPRPLILTCLWVDIDVGLRKPTRTLKNALRRVRKFGVKPTIIVRSGHGIHVYWCFKRPAIVRETLPKRLLHIITEGTRGDKQSAEVARLLRMPNTVNWKDSDHA